MIDLVAGYLRHGAERIVVLNNGVSTEALLRLPAHTILQRHGVRIVIADLPRLGTACDGLWAAQPGGHADERETSLMPAIPHGPVRPAPMGQSIPQQEEGTRHTHG